MKINFAQVPAEDVDMFGDEGLFGPDTNGNFYYNYVEYGTNPGGFDEVAINDGCNRFIPISVEHIPDLIAALHSVYKTSVALQVAENISNFVESDNEGYVEDFKVKYDPESIQSTTSWPFGR